MQSAHLEENAKNSCKAIKNNKGSYINTDQSNIQEPRETAVNRQHAENATRS